MIEDHNAGKDHKDCDRPGQAVAEPGYRALTENGVAEKDLLDGMGDYNIDTAVDKVRIPYAVYLGEGD